MLIISNVPDNILSSALTRPGRFDRIIAVPLPDIRGRVQLLQHFMKEVVASVGTFFLLLGAIQSLKHDVLTDSCRSEGTSSRYTRVLRCRIAKHGEVSTTGAFSSSLGDFDTSYISQAAIQASKEGYNEVTLKHFEWAKARVLHLSANLHRFSNPVSQDRILLGAERKSAYIDEKNKLLTAYHEVHHQPHKSRVEVSKLMDGGREDMP